MGTIRVAVASAPGLVREGLRALLEGAGFSIVGTAASATAALALARECRPDVVLLDLGLSGGLEAVREVAALSPTAPGQPERPATRVLLLARGAVVPLLTEAVLAGARGVVLEECQPEMLFRAVRTVARGEFWVDRDSVVAVLHGARVRRGRGSDRATPAESLTSRERQIVRGVASGDSNRELAVRLGISEATVKYHVASVYDKLGVFSRAELAAAAVHRRLLDDLPEPGGSGPRS